MNILMIAPQPFYTERGTPMNVRLLCQVLGNAGHSIDLLVFPTGQDLKIKNVRIIRIPNLFKAKSIPIGPSLIKMAFDILLTTFSMILCLIKRYEVIHGIEEGGFLAVALGKCLGKQSIFDMDSSISEQLRYSKFIKQPFFIKPVILLEKLALGHSSMILTVCSALTEKARMFSPKGNIVQIEDIPLLDISENSTDRLTEKMIYDYGLGDSKRVVYTGNLEAYQGIDLLLDAWEKFLSLEGNIIKSVLVIVGGPEDRVSHYKRMTEIRGLTNSVCWIGPRPSNEMGAWMEMSHVLVSPRSEGDNTPLKVYSYMNSGRPIVATRRRTHTQVLDDTTAFLTEPEHTQFAEAIFTVLKNPGLAREKSEKARQTVEDKYSYGVFRKKLIKAYDVLNRKKSINI